MKKIIYILFIVFLTLNACSDDYQLSDQGVELELLPKYVAFAVNGAGKTIAPINLNENSGTTGTRVNIEVPSGTLSDITVNYSLSGTAVFGIDYTINGATVSGGSVVIQKKTTPNLDGLPDNVSVPIIILKDNTKDGAKTIIVTLTSATSPEGSIVVGRGGQDLLKTAIVNII